MPLGRKKRIGSATIGASCDLPLSGQTIEFKESNRAVKIVRKIDEGVFLARDPDGKEYALKRIDCGGDKMTVEQCRNEAEIHNSFISKNLMPLLGMKVSSDNQTVSMLFPYISRSLGEDITSRGLLSDIPESQRRPYTKQEVLTIFHGIVSAVSAMHEANLSHRDIKVENILMKDDVMSNTTIPVLADFGSAGPLIRPLRSKEDIAQAGQEIQQTTTLAYRAPELLLTEQLEQLHVLNYGAADVWALGCVLFSMMYGTTPFETEWRASWLSGPAEGTVEAVACTEQKILHRALSFPPGETAADRRYGEDMKDLVKYILNRDVNKRPSSVHVAEKVGSLLGVPGQLQ